MTPLEKEEHANVRLILFWRGLSAVCYCLIFVLSTAYVFLNATNQHCADVFLLLLLFVSLPVLFLKDSVIKAPKSKILFFVWGYLCLALAGVLYSPMKYVFVSGFIQSFFRIIVMLFIVIAVWVKSDFMCKIIRWLLPVLCFALSLAALCVAYGVVDKNVFTVLTPWRVVSGEMNDKIFCFYLLFAMWAAVALLWRRSVVETLLAVILVVLTSWVLLLHTSESSQLACFVGLIVFACAHVPVKKGRYWVYLCFFMLFLVVPLLWLVLTPIGPSDPMAVYNDSSSFLRQHWNIGVRIFMYDFYADLVRKEFLFGYGFGCLHKIPLSPGIIPGWSGHSPGGHPHNIVFLMLLDHGILGYLWFVGMVYVLFKKIYTATLYSRGGAAIWALAISAQVIFSLSFSIWYADVVLTYGLFFAFLIIAMSSLSERTECTCVTREGKDGRR